MTVSFYPVYYIDGRRRAVPGIDALALPEDVAAQLAVTLGLRVKAGHLEAAPLGPIEACCGALLEAGPDNVAVNHDALRGLLALAKEGRVCGASHICAD